jgi:hypothetical protein
MSEKIVEEMQEVIETDILKKEYRDLSDTEKAQIVRELQLYSLSDSWTAWQAELVAEAEKLTKKIEAQLLTTSGFGNQFMEEIKKIRKIEKEVTGKNSYKRNKDLDYSQCDRDNAVAKYMTDTVEKIDDSFGGKVFKNKLELGSKQYKKSILEKIEPGYDADCYTDLDMLKNQRALCLSVKVWLQQTINAYEKPQEAPEIQSAY